MLNFNNKKGSALMQVLLVTVVVATIATFIMRITMTRTSTAARTLRSINAKTLMDGCNAQVQVLIQNWVSNNQSVPTTYVCNMTYGDGSGTIPVTANISPPNTTTADNLRTITYSIAPGDLAKL